MREQMLVSIITPTYNSEKTIKYTMESILSQDYPTIELIIVDGDSNDQTISIVNQFKKEILDRGFSIKVISEKDNGIYEAMNKGINSSSGNIIGILNSDDFYFDKKVISNVVHEFIESNVTCVYGDLIYINDKYSIKRVWKSKEFIPNSFNKNWAPPHPTFFCKREIYQKYGKYNESYKISSDFDFMYRVIEINKESTKHINKFIVVMRLGGESTRNLNSTRIALFEIIDIFKKNNKRFNLFVFLFYKLLKIKQKIIAFTQFKNYKIPMYLEFTKNEGKGIANE